MAKERESLNYSKEKIESMKTAKKSKSHKALIERTFEETELTTGRGGNANFPNSMKHSKSEDVKRIGANLMKWYNMDKAVTDEELSDRMLDFFEVCFGTGQVPTVEKMSLALGYDWKTLREWENGGPGSTTFRCFLIKKAKEVLASFDAEMVTEGKINPITYIFRAKNYFGMKDQQEHIVTPNNPLGETEDVEEIKRRLAKRLGDGEE